MAEGEKDCIYDSVIHRQQCVWERYFVHSLIYYHIANIRILYLFFDILSLTKIFNQSFTTNATNTISINNPFLDIKFETDGDSEIGREYCYYDNIYLYGSQTEINLPITIPYYNVIQCYIQCDKSKIGTTNSTHTHYYAFDNKLVI